MLGFLGPGCLRLLARISGTVSRCLLGRRASRTVVLFAIGLVLALGLALPASAQSAEEVTWEDLKPASTAVENPLNHLPPQQYSDMSRLAKLRSQMEAGKLRTDGPEAKQIQQLTQTLNRQGVEVEKLWADLSRVRVQWRQRFEAINPELEGQRVKLAGFVLPLGGTQNPFLSDGQSWQSDRGPALPHNLASSPVLKQNSDQSQTQADAGFLLVPYVGACIHVPPPAPNQMVYIEPPGAESDPSGSSQAGSSPSIEAGLFERVWLEGQLRHRPGTYSLFLVDGVRDVRASYVLELETITPYVPEGTGLLDFLDWGDRGPSTEAGPWLSRARWQSLQAQASTLVTGALVGMRDRRSPAAISVGILIAFGYGILHTLGPGHGKALIVSYFVGEGGSLRKGISMGVRVAIFHVFSAILVAVITDLVVRQTAGSAPGSYRLVRLASYGAIAAIGARMLWKATQPRPALASAATAPAGGMLTPALPSGNSLAGNPLSPNLSRSVLAKDNQLNLQHHLQHQMQGDCSCYDCLDPNRSGGWLSLAIGAVPCSGALLVLIYGLANDLLWPAVAMVVAISLGMAIALSGIGIAAVWGRQYAERRIAGKTNAGQPGAEKFGAEQLGAGKFGARQPGAHEPGLNLRRQQQLFQLLRIGGALCVLIIGMFLFGLTLSAPTLPMLA